MALLSVPAESADPGPVVVQLSDESVLFEISNMHLAVAETDAEEVFFLSQKDATKGDQAMEVGIINELSEV